MPCFFSFLSLVGGGGGDGIFFHFSLVPNVFFPLCSFKVPNEFPIGSQYVCQHVLHSTSLLSHMVWQMLFSFTYIGGLWGETLCFKI